MSTRVPLSNYAPSKTPSRSPRPADDRLLNQQPSMVSIEQARQASRMLTPHQVLQLQRLAGNQAVGRLLAGHSQSLHLVSRPARFHGSQPGVVAIQREYSHLNVASVGAMLDDEGNFIGESQTYHDEVKADLEEEGLAATERDVRIAMLTRKIEAAWARKEVEEKKLKLADPEAKVLGVFTAPEWYFKQPTTPFTRADYDFIVEAFRALSSEYPDMLIVPGTILWAEGGGGVFAKRRRLRNTALVLLNGVVEKVHHKFLNAGDTQGYFGATRGDANEGAMAGKISKLRNKANRAYARGRGEVDSNLGGNRVKADSSLFEIGNLKFALEICGDHSSQARARADVAALGGYEGAHVHIVVSHGAEFVSKDVLRQGGIGIGTDASYTPATTKKGAEGGGRRVFVRGDKSASYNLSEEEKGTSAAELARLDFGTYPLPE